MKKTKPKFVVGDLARLDGVQYEIANTFWNGFTWMCTLKDHPQTLSCGEEYLTKIERWFTVHIERDSWSGPTVDLVEEWDTQGQAKASADAVNAQNTENEAPETYYTAEVSNDSNLTQHKYYVDKRGQATTEKPEPELTLKEQVTELSQIFDRNDDNASEQLRSKLVALHNAVQNTPEIPVDVFDEISEKLRRAALLGLIMVTVQAIQSIEKGNDE